MNRGEQEWIVEKEEWRGRQTLHVDGGTFVTCSFSSIIVEKSDGKSIYFVKYGPQVLIWFVAVFIALTIKVQLLLYCRIHLFSKNKCVISATLKEVVKAFVLR